MQREVLVCRDPPLRSAVVSAYGDRLHQRRSWLVALRSLRFLLFKPNLRYSSPQLSYRRPKHHPQVASAERPASLHFPFEDAAGPGGVELHLDSQGAGFHGLEGDAVEICPAPFRMETARRRASTGLGRGTGGAMISGRGSSASLGRRRTNRLPPRRPSEGRRNHTVPTRSCRGDPTR